MYTIAFDETTNFETLKTGTQKKEPVMLAGIIYNDNSEIGYKKGGKIIDSERERIILYYKAVCESAGTTFPKDLHSNGSNRIEEKKTKEEIEQTLGEFIKKGTYRGQELLFSDGNNNIVENGGTALHRDGTYQIVCILKTPGASAELIENDVQRDDIASNLYLNMVQEYIKKGVFYNLNITESRPSVVFNIPSRKLEKKMVEGQDNYNRYGYGTYLKPADKRKEGDKDKYFFKITDEGYYHALITEFSDLRKISVKEIFTKSISYTPKQLLKQAFLFLADSVCSILSFKNEEPYDQDIRKRMNSLNNSKRNLFFYYEGRDDFYDKAVRAYIRKDMITALAEVYNGRHWSEPVVKSYYRKKWYAIIEKKVLNAMDCGILIKSIDELDRYRYSDNLEQEKLLYMLDVLEKAEDATVIDNRYRFKLADIGISAYTHTGNPQMAKEYFLKCMKYQDDIDTDDLQRAQIRYITTLNDLFAFEQARDYALGLFGININKQHAELEKKKKLIQRVIEALLSKGSKKTQNPLDDERDQVISLLPERVSRPNMYKILSSLGQTYAFMKDPLAEYCFTKAINDIQYAPDSSITRSFLLHWYIDNRDEANYRKHSLDYFNRHVDLNDQLSYLIEEGSKKREDSPKFSLGYALFVFIKAFYTFYKDDPRNNTVLKKLIHINDTVNSMVMNGDQYMKNHPWEIIFKYAAMLSKNTGAKKESIIRADNKLRAKAAIGKRPEYIIKKVMEFGDIELLAQELTSDDKLRKYHKKIDRLWNELFLGNVFPGRDPLGITEKEKLEDLNSVFTYMYH